MKPLKITFAHQLQYLIFSFQVWILCAVRNGEVEEYCTHESFNASCKPGEVILMKSAVYGRMRAGKCANNVNLNCAVDVLSNMDRVCSGKRSCSFVVPGTDTGIYETKPCGKDHQAYIEAAYDCVNVEHPSPRNCIHKKVMKLTKHHGYISSLLSGSWKCPWLIETYPGQQINLTFYNLANHTAAKKFYNSYTFNGEYSNGKSYTVMHQDDINIHHYNSMPRSCQSSERIPIGVIYEALKQTTVEMCLTNERRIFQRYISQTNAVKFRFEDKTFMKNLGRIIVEFKVSGCADIEVPADTFAQRDGNTLRVKCNHSRAAWYLTCHDDKWVGEVGNCSLGNGVEILNLDYNLNVEANASFPFGILFVVAIGVAIGIVFGGGMLVCLIMYNKRQERDQVSFLGNMKKENQMMYVSPDTRAWINAQQHHTDPEHDRQYIDEGIVKELQHSREPPQYTDNVHNDFITSHPPNNQSSIMVSPISGHNCELVDSMCHSIVVPLSAEARLQDKMHVYERPQST